MDDAQREMDVDLLPAISPSRPISLLDDGTERTEAHGRASLRILVALFAIFTFARAASSATSFFYLDSDGSTESTIYRVERATGQLTVLGSLQAPSYALAAASDQVLYVVTTAGAVFEVAVEPFTVTQVGSIGLTGVTGLAFANGELVATDEDTRSLYRIQLAPLAATLVGPILLSGSPLNIGGGDIAVDAAGTWYLWSNGTLALYRLDVTTGVVTLLPAPAPPPGTLGGLAIDFDDGALLASSAQPQSLNGLVTLDPTGAKPIAVEPLCLSCPTPFQMHYGDLASAPSQATGTGSNATPTPSTTTTTTPPCTTARCSLDASVASPACAGQVVPSSVTAKFDQAATFIEDAGTRPAKQAGRLLKRARRALKSAKASTSRAARGKKPKISSECATVLEDAVVRVLSDRQR
jgi:hypothetical protein